MGRPCNRELALLPLLGYLACLTVGHTRADVSSLGRVFLLELQSASKGGQDAGFEAATNACIAQGARVASGADLHHAVLECALSACSRGWLSGPSIGTTVCSQVAGSLISVDVQLENVTGDNERLGVFCVKDSDAPCGQPPSLPNSHLQGKTGLDIGDELLYACNPGYKLPNGETAFSLLCDSCGEWYGLVQHCVIGGAETTDHKEEESTPEPKYERTAMSEEEEIEEDSTVSVTEPPVSLLSQKHMFWFPSEAFQDENKPPVITPDYSVKSPTTDQNHSQPEPDLIIEEYDPNPDPDYDNATDHPTNVPISPSVGSTADSWLDGYLVYQGEDKTGGKSTGEAGPEHGLETDSMTDHSEVEVFKDTTKSPMEAEIGGLTDHTEEEDIEGFANNPKDTKYEGKIHRKGEEDELSKGTTRPDNEESVGVKEDPVVAHYGEATEKDEIGKEMPIPEVTESEGEIDGFEELGFDGVTESPNAVEVEPTTFVSGTKITTSTDDIALHKLPIAYTPASAPENVSTSQEGLGPEHTATPSGMVFLYVTPGFTDDFITQATPIIEVSWETNDNGHFLEHDPNHGTTEIPENSELERGRDHSLDQQERAREGTCVEDPCHVSGRGPMIAAIIVGIVAALVGVFLGVCCYKKWLQKSSHYQLNGTNRQTQCIELQQTV
ncbi:sushi domain-containing protein 5 isoform X2 [Myxocyprinus asiaticus]|uniref:sushi domain-containing protein 5 isoform X2 n=1 Tax=Myxocyprinus asiaticus TaxID=70543 RepID=UPI0022239E6F|nr:sushi domain-containing protein 5 isoform X2 [Myxocyprinus asiaticus]